MAQKMPTPLLRLMELIQELEPEAECDYGMLETLLPDIKLWLQWTHNFLTNRNMYHKKQRIKKDILVKMATQLLSKDEVEAIDRQAEEAIDADNPRSSGNSGVSSTNGDFDPERNLAPEEDNTVEDTSD